MNFKLPLALLAGTTALAMAFPVMAAETAQDFVNKAAAGGMFEVESSKLADAAAQDASVKDFAHMMVSDHTGANAKLMKIAGEQKLTVPTALDAEHQADLDKLKDTKGQSFDQAYVEAQRAAHDDAVALFEDYAKDGDNAPLKAFAGETLPTLKMHQEKVAAMATTMDATPAAAGATDATTGTDKAAAPVPGANSFTEDQAKEHIVAAGYSDVSGLTKDENGIWRGEAKKDGKSMPVALDYQGNVTSKMN